MVEEDEERPVNQPGSLLKSLEVGTEGGFVDELLQPLEVFEGGFPILHQDFGGQLAPKAVQVVLVGRLDQDTMKVKVLGSICGEKTDRIILMKNRLDQEKTEQLELL